MNLKLVFRIGAVIAAINALGLLFMPATFFEMANLTVSPEVITLGQFIGVGVIILAIVFQQELRRFLIMIGKGKIIKNKGLLKKKDIGTQGFST